MVRLGLPQAVAQARRRAAFRADARAIQLSCCMHACAYISYVRCRPRRCIDDASITTSEAPPYLVCCRGHRSRGMALYQRKLERDLFPARTPPPIPYPAEHRYFGEDSTEVPLPLNAAPTPWAVERQQRLASQPSTSPRVAGRAVNGRSGAAPALGPRVQSQRSSGRSPTATALRRGNDHSSSPPTPLRNGRYVPPTGTPRVNTGLKRPPTHASPSAGSSAAAGTPREGRIPTARERVLAEEGVSKARRRSPSPAFRSTSPRFGIQHKFSIEPSLFDRGSYLRPAISSGHDFYVPPGMAQETLRARSPGRVGMASTTPRFQQLIPHGTGMVCPVLSARPASPRLSSTYSSYHSHQEQ
jgi:hypothetical protein